MYGKSVCFICDAEYPMTEAEHNMLGDEGYCYDPTDFVCPACIEAAEKAEQEREEFVPEEGDYPFPSSIDPWTGGQLETPCTPQYKAIRYAFWRTYDTPYEERDEAWLERNGKLFPY